MHIHSLKSLKMALCPNSYIHIITGIMPHRRGHSGAMNIDANQMDASKIDATIYQKHNKRFLFL